MSRVEAGAAASAATSAGPGSKSASSGRSLEGLIQTVASPTTWPCLIVMGAIQLFVSSVGESVFLPARKSPVQESTLRMTPTFVVSSKSIPVPAFAPGP